MLVLQDALDLERSYNSTTAELNRKYDETQALKRRADDLRDRAKLLYEDYFYKQESLKGTPWFVARGGYSRNPVATTLPPHVLLFF